MLPKAAAVAKPKHNIDIHYFEAQIRLPAVSDTTEHLNHIGRVLSSTVLHNTLRGALAVYVRTRCMEVRETGDGCVFVRVFLSEKPYKTAV